MNNPLLDHAQDIVSSRMGLCRICYLGAPLLWAIGCFYIGLNSITIYILLQSKSWLIVVLSLFCLICAILTTSNIVHACLQLPTSKTAIKFQKHFQAFMILIFTAILGGTTFNLLSDLQKDEADSVKTFLMQTGAVYILLALSSVACFFYT